MHGLFTTSMVIILAASLALAGVPASGSLAAPAQRPIAAITGGRLVILSKLDGPPLPENLHILEDYGSFVLAQLPEGQVTALAQANIVDLLPDRTVISLNGTIWDTQKGEPAIPDNLRSAVTDPYFLIQFYGPVKNEWVTNLEALGVIFEAYYPNYTYIVRMDPALLPKVQAAHALQWVGRYHPAYRLVPDEELAKAQTENGRLALNVLGFSDVNVAELQSQLEEAGATVQFPDPSGSPIIRIWAGRELLPKLAALPGVFHIEAYDPPVFFNDNPCRRRTPGMCGTRAAMACCRT